MKQLLQKSSKTQDPIIVKWKKRYADASSNQADLFASFQRWYDDFYAYFKEDIAPWRSKVLDPKIAGKAITIISKLALFNPEPKLSPRSKYDYIKAKNNQSLLGYQVDNPDFDIPMFQKKYGVITDMAVCGYGLALLPWKSMEKTYYKRVMKDGKIDFQNDKEIKEKIGFNDFIPWSVFRAYLTPGATSWQSAPWKILTDFKTDDEIEKFMKEMGFESIDLKNIKETGTAPDSYEDSRNRLLSQSSNKGRHELWLCYDEEDKEFVYILDKIKVIGTKKNIYWHGKFPLVPFYLRPRAFSPFGDGLYERIERVGSANNSLLNHFIDQLDLSLNGVILNDTNTEIDVDMTPGGSITYDGANKPEPWTIPQPDIEGFSTARTSFSQTVEEQTISQYEQGISSSEIDKTQGTKGGTLALMSASSDIVKVFIESYASSCKQWYSMWISNNQQFMDRKVSVRILGEKGYFPQEISPEDIVTSGNLDIDIDVEAMITLDKNVDRQNKIAYSDKVIQMIPASVQAQEPIKVNFFELNKMLGDGFNIPNAELIVAPATLVNNSPTEENDLMLQGKEEEPQEGEDHKTHIFYHQELLDDPGVDESLKKDIIAPHIYIHQEFVNQILNQVKDAAATAKRSMDEANNGGANAIQTNPGETQQGLPQEPKGGMDSQMGGTIPAGQGSGSGNPQQGVQGSVPVL